MVFLAVVSWWFLGFCGGGGGGGGGGGQLVGFIWKSEMGGNNTANYGERGEDE